MAMIVNLEEPIVNHEGKGQRPPQLQQREGQQAILDTFVRHVEARRRDDS